MISLIVAIDKNNLIGKTGKSLPWHLPNDLKYFKTITEGNIVVMGRKTFECIGKPLSNRINLVISRSDYGVKFGYTQVPPELVLRLNKNNPSGKIFIIGGAEIYKLFMPYCDRLYITRIEEEFEGDIYFPELDSNWEINIEVKGPIDEKNPYNYYFQVWGRK
jgi:dihydrofolate reductase